MGAITTVCGLISHERAKLTGLSAQAWGASGWLGRAVSGVSLWVLGWARVRTASGNPAGFHGWSVFPIMGCPSPRSDVKSDHNPVSASSSNSKSSVPHSVGSAWETLIWAVPVPHLPGGKHRCPEMAFHLLTHLGTCPESLRAQMLSLSSELHRNVPTAHIATASL